MTRWICTANSGFGTYAMEELRRRFPDVKLSQLTHNEIFLMEVPLDHEPFMAQLLADEPIFLRHIQPVHQQFELTQSEQCLQEVGEWLQNISIPTTAMRVSLHIRRAEGTPFSYSNRDARIVWQQWLTERAIEPTLQSPQWLLSVFIGQQAVYVGAGAVEEHLSDWAGGAVRFQREEGQISRAKFKLLEAERAFGLNFATFNRALDIGAAPGGWTQLLLERGLKVTAVDPGELHPSLKAYSQLTYLRKNAADIQLQPESFDLLVCDMSWSPMQMVRLITDLLPALQPGASAIVTIKLMHKKPFQTIRDVLARFAQYFYVRQAKQLFHNREEITLYIVKK